MASSAREAFFSSFSRRALSAIRAVPNAPKIILTGSIVSDTPAHHGYFLA